MKHLLHPGHRRLSNPRDPEESRGGPSDTACGYFDTLADELVHTAAELTASRDACPACFRVAVGASQLARDHARAIDRRARWRRPKPRFRR